MYVPKYFWANVVMDATYFMSQMFASIIDYYTSLRRLPSFHSIPHALNLCLKVFSCVFYLHIHALHRENLIYVLSNVSLWFTLIHKRDTDVFIPLPINIMLLWMFSSMKMSLIFFKDIP